MKAAPLMQRLFNKIIHNRVTGCWEWTASISTGGYGQIGVGSRVLSAHRVCYELMVGPIGRGLHLDHLCRNRKCANPEHLEPVTPRENMRRGNGWSGLNFRKTHCPYGHEYTQENTAHYKGGRECRTCRMARGTVSPYVGKGGVLGMRTHCSHGHEFTVENIGRIKGRTGRYCRECERIRGRAKYAKSKAKESVKSP